MIVLGVFCQHNSKLCFEQSIYKIVCMKIDLLKSPKRLGCWNYRLGVFMMFLFLSFFNTNYVKSQTVVVKGNENNVNITKLNLTVGSDLIEQNNPTQNTNPSPGDIPVLIESIVLENGEEIFVTSRRPEVMNPNPLLGSTEIADRSVEIIIVDKPAMSHRDPDFLSQLTEVVSTPDLRSYWSIGAQPSIPNGASFVDFRYPFPSSGYIMISERNGNSFMDLIPLGLDGKPIPGATTVQIKGYQWNTGVNHAIDIPSQKQWLVVFSASLFNTLQAVNGVRIVSLNEPDGKLVFFVGNIAAAPDYGGPVNSLKETKGVLNVLANDELNKGAVQPFDVEISVITPFPENTLVFNDDGSVDVPAGTPAGTYSMTYKITDVVGGEADQATVSVKVFEMMPEANDDFAEVTLLGKEAALNVLDNDYINGEEASLDEVALSEVTNNTKGVLSLSADGTVDVAANAPSGVYLLTYQICDLANVSKCDTAIVSIFIAVSVIDAVDDNFGSYNQNGILGNILINDRINGVPVSPDRVNVVITDDGGLTGLIIDETGVLRLPGRIAAGSYVLEYSLSETANTANIDVAKVRFTVKSSLINTVNDVAVTNQNKAVTVLVLNNDQTASGNFNLSSLKVSIAPANGTVSVQQNGSIRYVPASNFVGEDTFTYKVCDSLDGTACSAAVVTVTVRPIEIDLKKTVNKTKVSVGETITYTITITNNSAFGVTNIVLQDILPELLLYVESSPGVSADDTWTFAQLAPDEKLVITIETIALSPGEVTNTANLQIGDYKTSAESPSVAIGQLPVDMKISKTSHAVEIYKDNEFEYEILVENVGTSPATGVTVADKLPSGLSYVSSSYSASSGEIVTDASVSGNTITWSIASFPAGESLTILLKVKADQPGAKINVVDVGVADQEELNPQDNTAQDNNEVLTFSVPNVITPGDKDNKNDELVIKGIELFSANRLVIFNRWGNHVFEADNYQNNWDAEGLSAGSYYYVLELTDSNGKNQTFKGWVQVIKD